MKGVAEVEAAVEVVVVLQYDETDVENASVDADAETLVLDSI